MSCSLIFSKIVPFMNNVANKVRPDKPQMASGAGALRLNT